MKDKSIFKIHIQIKYYKGRSTNEKKPEQLMFAPPNNLNRGQYLDNMHMVVCKRLYKQFRL